MAIALYEHFFLSKKKLTKKTTKNATHKTYKTKRIILSGKQFRLLMFSANS